MLLIVDRPSGWIPAVPCWKLGFIGEKAALLVHEQWLNVFSFPATITSDWDTMFLSGGFKGICRLQVE